METSSYKPDLRDIEFVLFEHLKLQTLLGQGEFSHVAEEDLRMVLQAGADFASDVLAPTNALGDVVGCRYENGAVIIPEAFAPAFQAVREQGWCGLVAPLEAEGQGLPHTLSTAVDEMMIAANPAINLYMGLNRAAANLLLRHASEELKAAWVPKLLSFEWQGTMCLTEAGAGSDVGASTTKATPVGDGTYQIKGTKVFITSGEHQLASNHVHLVLARLPDAPSGVKGLSLFLVPRYRLDASGALAEFNDVICSKIEEKMGIHGSATCVLNFGDQDACLGYLIGGEHQGIMCMFHMMNEERVVVGLQGQALAAAMYTKARQYASERVQGSDIGQGKSITEEKVTIDQHPDVRRMLLTVKALAEGGRALLYVSAYHQDKAALATDPAEKGYHEGRNALYTPICKAWGSDTGVEACSIAMQIYGGAGYCRDYPAEQAMRDARIAPIYEGTNGIQAIDLLMRKVMGGGGKLAASFAEDLTRWLKTHSGEKALEAELKALGEAQGELFGVTKFLGQAARADVRLAALGASPYLVMFGNVVVAWLLLQQAVVSLERLAEFNLPTELEAKRTFLQDNEAARFYAGKVETARFFVHQVLSQNAWRARQILSGDRSALDIVF